MKARELMRGDLVYYTGDGEPKIKYVDELTALNQVYLLNGKLDPGSWFIVGEKYIEPIPITPEILEKNGWKYEFDKEEYRVKYMLGEKGKNCWMMWSCKYHIIDIQRQDENLDMYNLCITKVCIPCEYVHQLQQALRLSELTELANNFKV